MAPPLALPSPEHLTPEDGWAPNSEYGYMAFERTKAGRLVSLKALVHWLMDNQAMPCSMAVDAVCDKLQDPRAISWLYLVAPGKLARELTDKDDFAWSPVIVGHDPNPDPADCGVAGALTHMREYWGESASPSACNYIGAESLDPLAMRMDVAHALWGWGAVASEVVCLPSELADWAALVAYRRANPGSDWGLGNQVAVGKTELGLRKKGGKTESDALADMAREVGLKTRQAMHNALHRDRMRAKKNERAVAAQPITQVRDGKWPAKAA